MKRVALLFSGQGSQYLGMGKKYYEEYAEVRQLYEEASDILGFDMKKLCFDSSMEELTKTENCQPAVLTTSVAAYRVFEKEVAFIPYVAAGHSLGEYSALTCGGAMSFKDAVMLVRKRGIYMSEETERGRGNMAAVRDLEKGIVGDICKEISDDENFVSISAYNSPDQTVISGSGIAVEKAAVRFKEMGASVIPLKVSNAFHSIYMAEAKQKLDSELDKIVFQNLKWTVLSNVTGRPYTGRDEIKENLSKQMILSIQWQETVRYMWNEGISMAVEFGPKTVLKNLMKQRKSIDSYSFDVENDVNSVKNTIKVIKDNKKVITKSMAIAVATQNTNWDNDAYAEGVIKPYQLIQGMQDELEKEDREPDMGQMIKAVEMLISVFETKGTPIQEQKERFDELYNVTGNKELFDRIKFNGSVFTVE